MPFVGLISNYRIKLITIVTMVSKAKSNAIYLWSSIFKEEGIFLFSLLIIMLASTLIPVRGTVEKTGSGQSL